MAEKLQELHDDNNNLRDIINSIHISYHQMCEFNVSLRDQMRRNLYSDPPPGIIYGQQTRTIGTQTDFVPPKENERSNSEVAELLGRDGC